MHKKIVIFKFLIITLISSNFLLAENSGLSNCELSRKIIPAISKLKKLPLKEEVPCLQHNKQEIVEYLEDSLKKRFTEDKIDNESLAFRSLGLIPWNYDYKNELITLYKDQIGGYYDTDKKHFVMASWVPVASQESVAAHELTHALQDQYFNLSEIMDPKLTSDELLAHSALAEGDATLTMLEFLTEGKNINSDYISAFIQSSLTGASLNKSLKEAPSPIQSLLMFPYNSGLTYIYRKRQNNNEETINNLFKTPPKTTKEIIDERNTNFQYSKKTPSCKQLAEKSDEEAEEYEVAYEDRLGEFILKILLANEIKNKSLGWEDDQLCIFKTSNKVPNSRKKLYWAILLESEEKAKELSKIFQSHLKKVQSPNLPYKVESNGKELNISIFFPKT